MSQYSGSSRVSAGTGRISHLSSSKYSFTGTSRSVSRQSNGTFTDWEGMMDELFELDTVYMIESPHDSSSGIASDDHNPLAYQTSSGLSTFDEYSPPKPTSAEQSCDHGQLIQDRRYNQHRGRQVYPPQTQVPYPGQQYHGRFDQQPQKPYQTRPNHKQQVPNCDSPRPNGPCPMPNVPKALPSYEQATKRRVEKQHMSNYQHTPSHLEVRVTPQSRERTHHKMGVAQHPPVPRSKSPSKLPHSSRKKTHNIPHGQNEQYNQFPGHPTDYPNPHYHEQTEYVQYQPASPNKTISSSESHGTSKSHVSSRTSQPRLQCQSPVNCQSPINYHIPNLPRSPPPSNDKVAHNKQSIYGNLSPVFQDLSIQDTDRLIYEKHKARLDYFQILPDDVLTQIFSHLPSDQLCRCARVCRRFYDIAWDPTLWTCIRISDATIDADKALKCLTRRLSYETPTVCVMVERIHLTGCAKLTDRGLHAVAKRCPELRRLDLHGCSLISNISIFEVMSMCVNLEHLNTAGCPNVTCISLTPAATVQASAYGKQCYLRYLDMTDCVNLEDSGLQLVASYCSQLVFLFLRRCFRISDIGVQYIANYCPQLRELSVSDCRNVTDFGLRELAKLGTNLRYLSIAKCDKVSDLGVGHLAQHCPKLRYLNARGCEAVSDESAELLARCCPKLKSLDLGKCDITDEGLYALAQSAGNLRKLSLKQCEGITDAGVFALAASHKHLQQLNLQECHLSTEAYRAVKRSCKRCIIEHTCPAFY